MKKFSPAMSGGQMSAEAKAEWIDKSGKHDIAKGVPKVSAQKPNKLSVGVDGFDPGKRIKAREGVSKAKGMENGNHAGLSSAAKANSGMKTGPMTKAGKGLSGVTKSIAKANRKGVGGAGS